MKKLRVGVIYGGRSGEHEVSVASAASILRHLDRARYEAVPIRIEKNGRWTLVDKIPTAMSAADVLEQQRVDAARPARTTREAHLRAYPTDEAIVTIERSQPPSTTNGEYPATITGLGLDVIFPVLHGPYGEDGAVQGLLELANVLTGGNTDFTETITEKDILKLERAAFMNLAKNPKTLARMEVMLDTGKPLRN